MTLCMRSALNKFFCLAVLADAVASLFVRDLASVILTAAFVVTIVQDEVSARRARRRLTSPQSPEFAPPSTHP